MRTIYQLFITFEGGNHSNLLYSSRKKAIYDSVNRYSVGCTIEGVGVVTETHIEKRYLF